MSKVKNVGKKLVDLHMPVRVPSINRVLMGADPKSLDAAYMTHRALVENKTRKCERATKAVKILFTGYYDDEKWCCDPDNMHIKPFIDGLKKHVLRHHQDGPKEVAMVCLCVKVTGRLGCRLEVWEKD